MKLISIPFQDQYCFENEGILTREYAMLYTLIEAGHELRFVVNKPRTILDAKKIKVNPFNFPDGSIEVEVLHAIENARSVSPKRPISVRQLMTKREWWVDSYLEALSELPSNLDNFIVYTNSPFSWKLVEVLKRRGAAVLFDSMDNMMTYPHFWESEKAAAGRGYKNLLTIADYSCANSQRTVDFFKTTFGKSVHLIKNGVFQPRCVNSSGVKQISQITSAMASYDCCAGFIGKFGFRIDHEFIDSVAKANPRCLFVFIGMELANQCDSFNKVVLNNSNILKLPSLPSAYLYAVLNLFDVLMIPYSVGENENSGDPLKLYQYFMTGKPIACTPIREVDEYKDYILISHNPDQWTELINEQPKEARDYSSVAASVTWQERTRGMLAFLKSMGS